MSKRQLPYFVMAIVLGIGWIILARATHHHFKRSKLVIYTYSSFNAQWAPGPVIFHEFEKHCHCSVEVITVPEGGLLLQRLRMQGAHSQADVVVGLDQFDLPEARKNLAWRNIPAIEALTDKNLPSGIFTKNFVPFDWAPLTFIYRRGEIRSLHPFASLKDLLNSEFKNQIAMENPLTSSAGMQFLFWLIHIKGEDGAFSFLRELEPQFHSISASWSSAYGLFKRHQAKLAFSYLTSPVYHWVEEKDASYQPVLFSEGHPFQVEYAGVLANCRQCERAEELVRFLLLPDNQAVLMKRNYMLPVIAGVVDGTQFSNLPHVKLISTSDMESFVARKEIWLERWRQTLK